MIGISVMKELNTSLGASILFPVEFLLVLLTTIRSYRGSNHQRCSMKKGVLKKIGNFTGKYLCWSFFLIKLQLRVLSYEICEIFKNTYFEEHLRTTTAKSSEKESRLLSSYFQREEVLTSETYIELISLFRTSIFAKKLHRRYLMGP